MANFEHLELLKQGIMIWNVWRKENPEIRIRLNGAELFELNLTSADFGPAKNVGEAIWKNRTKLTGVNFGGSTLVAANFAHAKLVGADFRSHYRHEEGYEPKFLITDLRYADFNHALISGANFYGADLLNADFSNVVTEPSGHFIYPEDEHNEQGVFLNSSSFQDAKLKGATFNSAILDGVNFTNADLAGVDFTDAQIKNCMFNKVDLSKVLGLEKVTFGGPSTIGIDTIYKSRGNIPKTFLQGCGIHESLINSVPTMVSALEPIQFYTCFISFTEADDTFAQKLYNDLQVAGVRCWRWKEDAKWGRTLMRSINDAVQDYDKLIVICSGHSLKSPAVIREIERALQKEDKLAREDKEGEVLFPIRLDDYVFSEWQHYRKSDVTLKNVGDFRNWHNQGFYSTAFDRLIRDLKAEIK